jgi:hypothetical protein
VDGMSVSGITLNSLNNIQIINTTRKVQNKTHKKKRINKKWAKMYGYTYSNIIGDGEVVMVDGKLYMNQFTYTQLKKVSGVIE